MRRGNFINSKKQLYFGLISFPISIVLACSIVVGTPYLFVEIMNLMIIVILSVSLGAFIRELFLLKEKEKSNIN